jgi:biopolymer transport protein ExbB
MQGIAQFFKDGGNLMYVNLAVAVFAAALIVERIYMLGMRYRIAEKRFIGQIEKLVNAGNIEKAVKLCTSEATALLPQVVRAGLMNARMGGAAVTAAIDETMAEVMPLVTRRVGLLWGIANIATLIGLIGTIFGLIDSFAAQALASPEQKAVLLTRGIAHAMNNTALGLSIAVTCIIFHMILSSLTKNVLESLEFGAVRTTNILAKRFVKPASAGGPATGGAAAGATAGA